MTRKLKRFLTAMLTLLLFAPAFTAKAVDAPSDLSIKGWTVNGSEWGNVNKSDSKVTGDGTVFYFDVNLNNGRIFKFQASDGKEWGSQGNNGDETIQPETPYNLYNYGGNVTAYSTTQYQEGKTYITVAFYKNAETPQVCYSYTARPEIAPPGNDPRDDFRLIGDIVGSSWTTQLSGTKFDSNKLKFGPIEVKASLGNKENGKASFAFREGDTWWGHDGDIAIDCDRTIEMYKSTWNGWMVNDGTYTITVDFSNPDMPTFVITELKVGVPEQLYLIGHHSGNSAKNWGWDDGILAEKNGTTFTFNDIYMQGFDEDGSRSNHSYFAFSANKTQTANGSGKPEDTLPYYGPKSNTDVTLNNYYQFGGLESDLVKSGAWNVTNGNYDITVDFSNAAKPKFIITEHIPTLECPTDLYFIYKNNVTNNDWSGAGSIRYSSKNEEGNIFTFDKIDVNGADFVFSATPTKQERYFGTPTGAEHVYAKIKQPVPFSDEKSGFWHLSTNYKYRIEVDFTNLQTPTFTVYRVDDAGEVYPDVPNDLYIIGQGNGFSWSTGKKADRVDELSEGRKIFYFENVDFVGNGGVNSTFAFSSTQDKKDIYYTNPWAITNRPVTYDYPMDLGIGQTGNWIIQNTGLRNIVVSFEDPENPTVTISRIRSNTEVPSTLYMIGNISGTNGWADNSNSKRYFSEITGKNEAGKEVTVGYHFKEVTFNGANGTSTFAFTTQQNGKGNNFFGSNDLDGIDESADEGMVNKMRLVSNDYGKGWVVENGTYDFDVYFNDPTDPYFVFYVSEPENPSVYTGPGTVPDHLFLIGAVGSDDNNWAITSSYIEPTRVDTESGKIYFDNVYVHGQIGFSTDADHANHTPDACRQTNNFWGAMNSGTTAPTGAVNYLYTRAAGDTPTTGYGYTLQNGTGRYNITVTFGTRADGQQARPYFTYEYIPAYYFIGDINDWFSVEFQGGEQGINDGLFADRYSWQFEPVFVDENGNVLDSGNIGDAQTVIKTEWYKFDKFPGHLLSGQFKICTDGKWDGTSPYVHKQVVDPGAISGNGVTNQSLFEAYISRPITRDMIRKAKFQEYYKDMNDNVISDDVTSAGATSADYGVFTDLVRQGRSEVPTGNGGNLHLECNAVKDAVIYFKPGDTDPKIIVDGEPLDYYIFYGMESDEATDGLVTAKMQNDKPNSNNYYMAGINGLMPVGNEAHMAHTQGIDLVKIDLKNADGYAVDKVELWEALSAVIPNMLTEDRVKDGRELDPVEVQFYDNNTVIVADILGMNSNQAQVLPNMYDLSDLDAIYITKVPTGYENPAGEKYMFNFINALESETKSSSHALTTSHKYYFPTVGGAHVHAFVNDRNNYGGDANTPVYEIAYRVYYVHSDYNTYVIGTEHEWPNVNTTELGTSLGRSAGLKKPWDYNDPNHPVVTAGWVILDNMVHQNELRDMGAKVPVGFSNENWMVAHKNDHQPAQAAQAGPRKATAEANENDIRQGIRQRFANTGYVQYRITSKSKDGNTTYNTVFYPEIPDQQERDDQYFPINSQDVFAAFNNDNGLLTVVRGIEDDGIVDSEEAQGEVIWYNLQGQRVSNPSNGIFIKVQGKTSKKVLVK